MNEWINLDWNLSEEDQKLQNVSNLINIGFASIPLNRQIGVSKDYLYKPKDIANTLFLSELERNIQIYQPDVTIKYFKLQLDNDGKGRLEKLELELREMK